MATKKILEDSPDNKTAKVATVPEMRIFSRSGERLYLTRTERQNFLLAALDESPSMRMFCHVLHDTGCRPSEALELTPQRISFDEKSIVFRTLKKRTHDQRGREKLPQFRSVPVSARLLSDLDLVFGIRQLQKEPGTLKKPLWNMTRMTHYRLIKRVMARGNIKGPQATGKGLRHGYAVAMITAKRPVPIHLLAKALGHSNPATTAIYLKARGEEEHQLFMDAWDDD